MKVVRNAVAPIVVALVGFGVACAVFRGVTEPAGTMFGIPNRSAMIAAWWVLFAALPLAGSIDVGVRSEADWWAADHSKVAWLALVWVVPFFGAMYYATFVRHRVVGAYGDYVERVTPTR